MDEISNKDVQKALLKVFVDVDKICLELGINYWAAYGTLIGAIRHKGFIPWDDDLDLCMTRCDYDKFISYMENEYEGMLKIDTYKNNESYPYYITRVVDYNNFEFVFKDYDYKSGPFIDIYPLDGMGEEKDKKFWEQRKKQIDKIRKHLAYSCSKSLFWGDSLLSKFCKFPLIVICKLKGREYFLNKIDTLSKTFSWDESFYVGLPVWANKLYFHKKEDFSTTIRLPFEDVFINIPKNYDSILREIYGNYMEIPPKNEQLPQHGYTVYRIKEFDK